MVIQKNLDTAEIAAAREKLLRVMGFLEAKEVASESERERITAARMIDDLNAVLGLLDV